MGNGDPKTQRGNGEGAQGEGNGARAQREMERKPKATERGGPWGGVWGIPEAKGG